MSITQTITRYSCFLLQAQLIRQFRQLVVPVVGCVVSGAAFALVNPIDPALPMTTHVRVYCQDGSDTFNYGDSARSCSGVLDAGGGVFANSTASADLTQGTMRSVTTGRNYFDGTQVNHAVAYTFVDVYDTLTVNGNFTGTRAVELRLEVNGSAFDDVPGLFNGAVGEVFGRLGFFYSEIDVDEFAKAWVHIGFGNNTALLDIAETTGGATLTTNAGGLTNDIFDPADVQFVMSYVFPASPGDSFSFDAQFAFFTRAPSSLVPGSFGEATLDFGNTAKFSLIVPDDVTVSSASGAFLTAVPAVPEPSTFALLAAGVAALIARTRRRVA